VSMEYVEIEGIAPKVSRIGLGTWAIGGWMWGGTDEERSIQTICAALDRGITLIDTAPVYGQGRSEEIVGKAVQRWGRRDRVVLATKVGLEWGRRGEPVRNASRRRIHKEIADSLHRLRTDYVDVYRVLDQPVVQVALWGARSPEQLGALEETMGWSLDDDAMQAIDAIVQEHVIDPVGPEFMAPPARTQHRWLDALRRSA